MSEDPGNALSLTVRTAGSATVVTLAGELRVGTVDGTAAELAAAVDGAEGDVLLDLTDVGFMDSAGLRLMLAAQRGARERGRSFAVIGATSMGRLLDVASLDEHPQIYSTLDEALRASPGTARPRRRPDPGPGESP
ncbi:STAS domain-containing protein [Spirillospora sp. CA-294931]|uniref:STAS domain-containing protein n=1 Tax=Spirillospora sp. CA-294931 TaxID=3240042 RepID=UPI003D8D47CC